LGKKYKDFVDSEQMIAYWAQSSGGIRDRLEFE